MGEAAFTGTVLSVRDGERGIHCVRDKRPTSQRIPGTDTGIMCTYYLMHDAPLSNHVGEYNHML